MHIIITVNTPLPHEGDSSGLGWDNLPLANEARMLLKFPRKRKHKGLRAFLQ